MITTRMMMLQKPTITAMFATQPIHALRSNPSILSNPGKGRRRYTSYPSMDSASFITTVINRMAMPESPTVTDKNTITEFKITFDQFYRVMLHYTNWPEDSNKTIAKRVKMAVPVLTMKNCEAIVKQTFKYGLCIICTVPQDKAVLYKDALTQMGLNATIEEA